GPPGARTRHLGIKSGVLAISSRVTCSRGLPFRLVKWGASIRVSKRWGSAGTSREAFVGPKVGPKSPAESKIRRSSPKVARLWPNRLLGRPQRAFRELGNLECTPRSVRPMAQQQVVGPSEVRV